MQFPILSGMVPDNWFPDRISWLTFANLPTSVGSGPDNELYDKSKVVVKLQMLELAAVRQGSDEFPPLVIVRFQPVAIQGENSEILQLPQIRRHISSKGLWKHTRELVIREKEGLKAWNAAELRWDRTLELIRELVAELNRYTPREGIVAEVKRLQTHQAADACRDVSIEPVGAQVQGPQGLEVPDGRGEDTGKPIGWQAQRHYLAAAARHAFPAADAGGAIPAGQRTGVAASEPSSESKQSAGLVADAAVRSPGGDGHCDHDGDGGRKQSHDPLHCCSGGAGSEAKSLFLAGQCGNWALPLCFFLVRAGEQLDHAWLNLSMHSHHRMPALSLTFTWRRGGRWTVFARFSAPDLSWTNNGH
ncbi:hypothetical protein U9M48_020793 [Paspalum notatum var. saurae]|uniref:Uncharacterized protein n=1 Tax=Paspalum notatum var. saurae TaxID=547442 RepID=A0AAQ3TF05_PASNO